MKTETIQALTRINEIDAELATMAARRGELEAELSTLWDLARGDGITKTRPRKAPQEPEKKRGAKVTEKEV
jgi:hypothetical protein